MNKQIIPYLFSTQFPGRFGPRTNNQIKHIFECITHARHTQGRNGPKEEMCCTTDSTQGIFTGMTRRTRTKRPSHTTAVVTGITGTSPTFLQPRPPGISHPAGEVNRKYTGHCYLLDVQRGLHRLQLWKSLQECVAKYQPSMAMEHCTADYVDAKHGLPINQTQKDILEGGTKSATLKISDRRHL